MDSKRTLLGALALMMLASACYGSPTVALWPSEPPPTFTLAPLPSPSPSSTPSPTATSVSGPAVIEHVVVGLAPSAISLPGLRRCASSCPTPLVCESLADVSLRDGSLKPALAKRWEVLASIDGFVFELRDDVVRHDGKPLRAQDVAKALRRSLESTSGPPVLYAEFFESAYSLGNHKVMVKAKEPGCAFFTSVASLPLSFNNELIGTGPFKVTSDAELSMELRAFEAYRGRPPGIGELTLNFFKDDGALAEAMRKGKVDVGIFSPGVSPRFEGTVKVVKRIPSPEYFTVIFNLEDPNLEDRRIRKALSLAIDRERILAEVLGGEGMLIGSPFFPGYIPADFAPIPPYDPDYARELLAQAGWNDEDGDGFLEKDGHTLRISITTNGENPIRVQIAVLIAEYYRAAGVEAEVHILEWGNLLEALFTHDFQAAVFSWPISLDPDVSLFFSSAQAVPGEGFNFAGYRNPEVDELLKEGLKVPGCDPRTRAEIYAQVARILAQDRPYDFLFVPYTVIAANPVGDRAFEELIGLLPLFSDLTSLGQQDIMSLLALAPCVWREKTDWLKHCIAKG